jgi:flavin-dependent dehydrogenase
MIALVTPDYDVIILGGAFSGASAAILLRREHPQLRVLIVEKSEAFDAKVGEATTEMSAMFITRRLRMWHHLEAEQLPKEGLRYWFSNDKVTGHANATEAGGFVRSAVPAFQLRRDALDEHLLATAVSEGAELMRPARVTDVELGEFEHTVRVEDRTFKCRWLLDATGKATVLGRKLGIIDRNDEHPTAAIWCRWKNVRHIDDMALGGNVSSRRLATNHYMGFGYWIWVIPLGNGETSIGVVFDKRLMQLKTTEFVAFLKSIPSLAELLDGAAPRLDDLRAYAHLPYVSRQYMGNGWALLGDAAAFLDPYYSPGLDHAAFSVEATVEIIGKQSKGEDVGARIAEHNETFARSYQRFFDSIYKDKYFYMGEADLLAASFLLDTAHYYIFVVIPAYRVAKTFVWMPVLGPKPAFFSYHLIKFYNRRFKTIAMNRRAAGEAGLRNDGRRIKAYYHLAFAPMHMALRGLKFWLKAELDNVRLLFRRRPRVSRAPERGAQTESTAPPAPSAIAHPMPERSEPGSPGMLS